MSSSRWLAFFHESSMPSVDVASSTLGLASVAAIVLRHSRSTWMKRFDSCGIWRIMSSDEKMGSR
jgi:hypothetical protein